LQWAREHHCPWDTDHVRVNAARGGYADVLMWLVGQGGP